MFGTDFCKTLIKLLYTTFKIIVKFRFKDGSF